MSFQIYLVGEDGQKEPVSAAAVVVMVGEMGVQIAPPKHGSGVVLRAVPEGEPFPNLLYEPTASNVAHLHMMANGRPYTLGQQPAS